MSLNIEPHNYRDIPSPPQECVICFEKIDAINEITLWQCTQCEVKIHHDCINRVLTHTCPCCRKDFVNENNTIITIHSSPLYDLTTTRTLPLFAIYNQILKENFYRFSIFIIIGILIIMSTIVCVFFLLPVLIHNEIFYNFSGTK